MYDLSAFPPSSFYKEPTTRRVVGNKEMETLEYVRGTRDDGRWIAHPSRGVKFAHAINEQLPEFRGGTWR